MQRFVCCSYCYPTKDAIQSFMPWFLNKILPHANYETCSTNFMLILFTHQMWLYIVAFFSNIWLPSFCPASVNEIWLQTCQIGLLLNNIITRFNWQDSGMFKMPVYNCILSRKTTRFEFIKWVADRRVWIELFPSSSFSS